MTASRPCGPRVWSWRRKDRSSGHCKRPFPQPVPDVSGCPAGTGPPCLSPQCSPPSPLGTGGALAVRRSHRALLGKFRAGSGAACPAQATWLQRVTCMMIDVREVLPEPGETSPLPGAALPAPCQVPSLSAPVQWVRPQPSLERVRVQTRKRNARPEGCPGNHPLSASLSLPPCPDQERQPRGHRFCLNALDGSSGLRAHFSPGWTSGLLCLPSRLLAGALKGRGLPPYSSAPKPAHACHGCWQKTGSWVRDKGQHYLQQGRQVAFTDGSDVEGPRRGPMQWVSVKAQGP